jgi:SWIM zinc finger
MKAKGGHRFDVEALRERAGDKSFARGEEYYRSGQVQILAIERDRVLAQVAGSEDYRTELRGRGKSIEGSCSCRAFEDFGFCKHMVAAGLAANAAGDGEVVGALSRIRDHLKAQSVDSLADMIVKMAEQDTNLFRRLEIAAAVSQADDGTLDKQLRKAIDDATRIRNYIDYSSARDWAAGVNEALDAVETFASGARAGLALRLVERAIDRIEQAFESIDDSDGHLGALLHRAQDIHLAAATLVKHDPVRLARDLYAREMKDQYDVFSGAAARYADVLGEQGLAEYRRLAIAAWEKLPPRRRDQEFSTERFGLMGILDYFAERDGDVDARIALRAKDLSSPYNYLQLAEFCLSQGREQQALRRAEEGLWMFEDGRQDQRLVAFTSDLLAKAGRKQDAETLLWRSFEAEPDLQLYVRLRKLGGEAARERARQTLEALCEKGGRGGWQAPADLLIQILMREKLFDQAWSALRKFGGSVGSKEQLARATEKTHPDEAIKVHEESVEHLATNGSYTEAVKLVARMAKLRGVNEQAKYLIALKERHKRKRNFMKLLR